MQNPEDQDTFDMCSDEKLEPYTVIPNELLRTREMSPNAIWLVCYLLSNVKNWRINTLQIIKHCEGRIGRDQVRQIIEETLQVGYLKRTTKIVNGLKRTHYEISRTAKFKKSLPCTEFQDAGNQDAEFQDAENQDNKERTSRRTTIPKDPHPEAKLPKRKLSPPSSQVSSEALALSELFHSEILKVKPDFTKTPTQKWRKECERLLKFRSFALIKETLKWALSDGFWRKIVLSPQGLLNNLDRIEEGMKESASKIFSSSPQENELLAKRIIEKFPNDRNIVLGHDYIEFILGQASEHIKFLQKDFRLKVDNCLKKMRLSFSID